MRVVIDAPCIIAGTLGGPARSLLDAWLAGSFTTLVTNEILDEVRRFAAAAEVPGELSDGLIEAVSERAEIVDYEPSGLSGTFMIMEAAVAGGADLIVSEDQRLLRLEDFKLVPVVSAARFLESMP